MDKMMKVSMLAALAGILASGVSAQPPGFPGGKNNEEGGRGGKQGPGGRPGMMPSRPSGGPPAGFQGGPPQGGEQPKGRSRNSDEGRSGGPPAFTGGSAKRSSGGQPDFGNRAPSNEGRPEGQSSKSSRSNGNGNRPSFSTEGGGRPGSPFGGSSEIGQPGSSRGSKSRPGQGGDSPFQPGGSRSMGNTAGRNAQGPSGFEPPSEIRGGSKNAPSQLSGQRPGGAPDSSKGRGSKSVGSPGKSNDGRPMFSPPGNSGKSESASRGSKSSRPGGAPDSKGPGSRSLGSPAERGGKGAPGLPQGMSQPGGKGAVAGRGSQGLPPGLAGKDGFPGNGGKSGIAGRGGPAGLGELPGKGVARGLTGNLPPGLQGKGGGRGIPAAAMAGFSGKSVELPDSIRSSALSAFRGLDRNRKGDGDRRHGGDWRHDDWDEPTKAISIGLNFGGGASSFGFGYSSLGGHDAVSLFAGSRPIHGGYPAITGGDVMMMHGGYLPHHIAPPPPGYGYLRPPVLPMSIYQSPGYLPPALVAGHGVAPGFSWNYWDGRSHYDHSYASSVFVSIGHTPYNGYDGAMVSGHYYAFGHGWVDGCINYGSGRVWVPGFFAPQAVEECQPIPVWMPPAYEDVWTGCCWETVQVGGGYFAPAPVDECHIVTRHVWVPGHYEYAYV